MVQITRDKYNKELNTMYEIGFNDGMREALDCMRDEFESGMERIVKQRKLL